MSHVTFKEAIFFIHAESLEVGRERSEHTFAFRDKVSFEDLGLKSKRLPLRAFVLADPPIKPEAKSAHEKAQALLDFCQSPGAGWLTIPQLGRFWMVNTKCQWSRAQGQAHQIEFALEFMEDGPLTRFIQPLPTLDMNTLQEGIGEIFEESLIPLEPDQRAAWQDALSESIDALKTDLPFLSEANHLARTLLRAGGSLSALLAPLSQIERSLSLLKSSLASLANKPGEFAQSFLTLARQMASLGPDLGLVSAATATHNQAQITTLLEGVQQTSFQANPANALAHVSIRTLQLFEMLTRFTIALELAARFKPAFKEQGERVAHEVLQTLDALLTKDLPLSVSQKATLQSLLEHSTFETLQALHHKTRQAKPSKTLVIGQPIPLLCLAFEEKTEVKTLLQNNRHFFNPLHLAPQTELIS